jgi:protein Tex
MAKDAKCSLNELIGNEELVGGLNVEKYITKEAGEITLNDLIKELVKPSRDPRKIVRVFEFDKRLRSIADVEQGMEIVGIVNNVTNFGAFVDIGIKESGLIHISNLADAYVSNPADVVSVHQHVKAKVISIDVDRKRIGLKLI